MSDGTRQDTDRAPVHCSGGSSAGGHHGVSVTEKHADIQEDGLCAEQNEPVELTEQCAGDVSGKGLVEEVGRVTGTPAHYHPVY